MEIRGSSNTSGHIRSRTRQKRTSPSKVLSNSDSSQRLASSSARTTHEASCSAHTRPDSTHRGPSPPPWTGASASLFHVTAPPGQQHEALSSPEQARNAPNGAVRWTVAGLAQREPVANYLAPVPHRPSVDDGAAGASAPQMAPFHRPVHLSHRPPLLCHRSPFLCHRTLDRSHRSS